MTRVLLVLLGATIVQLVTGCNDPSVANTADPTAVSPADEQTAPSSSTAPTLEPEPTNAVNPTPTDSASQTSPAPPSGTEQSNPIETPPTTETAIVYLVIHADPDRANDKNFNRLRQLFDAVAKRGESGVLHHLTILFAPEWAPFILASPERIKTVRQWVLAGHELGMHHHTHGHFNPDGYAFASQYQTAPLCVDTGDCDIITAVNLVREMVEHPQIGGVLRSGGFGPHDAHGNDYRADLVADLDFATVGYPADNGTRNWWQENPTLLLGQRSCLAQPQYPNVREGNLLAIPHMQYYAEDVKANAVTLAAISAALDLAKSAELLGIVWHEDAYDGGQGSERIEALFDELDARQLRSQTVTEVLATPGCQP